jgi:hypothetical protein
MFDPGHEERRVERLMSIASPILPAGLGHANVTAEDEQTERDATAPARSSGLLRMRLLL